MNLNNLEKISAEDVAIADNNAQWLGIPLIHLMECAGYAITDEIIRRYTLNEESTVVIFCGTGNNGGDGFVVARQLAAFNIRSIVILFGTPEKIRTHAANFNWDIINKHVNHLVKTIVVSDSSIINDIEILKEGKEKISLIIDGLLGTGIQGKIRDPIASAIDKINFLKEKSIKVVSIDVPSGLDPNTGKVFDRAVKASLVIALHRIKKGLDSSNEYIDDLVVRSIGIPYEAELYVGLGDLLPTLKTRKTENHKGEFGRLLVIGGSKNYSGAPAYCSLTGIKFGLDLVITYTPEVIGNVIRKYSPNYIVRTSPGDWLNINAFDELAELIEWANAIIIGPGLGLQPKTEELLVKLLEKITKEKKVCVLDADALKLIKNHLNLIKGQNIILTPHEGELKIMANIELPPKDNILERKRIIFELAQKLGVTLIVKGPIDYISDGIKIKLNRTGVPEMSIGGTGDVLAGLCGCFLATENDLFKSACSAAFLNGYLGEFCKKNIGSRFNAMNMINKLQEAISSLSNLKT